MWKKLLAWILVTVILTGYGIQIVEAFDQKENVRMEEVTEKPDQNSLYDKSSCAYGCGFPGRYPV